jgi:hypothetical protein
MVPGATSKEVVRNKSIMIIGRIKDRQNLFLRRSPDDALEGVREVHT